MLELKAIASASTEAQTEVAPLTPHSQGVSAGLAAASNPHSTGEVGTGGGGTLSDGGVSERPKEHASKACEGATPPWVQIPPLPLRVTKVKRPVPSDRALRRFRPSVPRCRGRHTGSGAEPRITRKEAFRHPA